MQLTCEKDAEDNDDGQEQDAHEDDDCVANDPPACSLHWSFRVAAFILRAPKEGCSLINHVSLRRRCWFPHVV